jgi:hypothetical protein
MKKYIYGSLLLMASCNLPEGDSIDFKPELNTKNLDRLITTYQNRDSLLQKAVTNKTQEYLSTTTIDDLVDSNKRKSIESGLNSALSLIDSGIKFQAQIGEVYNTIIK